ncbi:MAG: hypothetical protein ACFFEN_13105 [Candidatus Thorarchaeota archaeon]
MPNNGKLFHLSKETNSTLKPPKIIRRSWITSCPDCGYVIRFAAEIGEKELLETSKSILHRKEFIEQGQTYSYNFHTIEKPFKDSAYYNEEINEKTQKAILKALKDLDLGLWGNLFNSWKIKEKIDSFKFLIRFCSYFEKFCETQIETSDEPEIIHKIDVLNLPEPLKNRVLKVYALKTLSVHDNYELTSADEVLIQELFVKLLLFLVIQRLEPLKLNKINTKGKYNVIDQSYYFLKLKEFLHNHFFELLGLKNFEEVFFNPILESLKIPEDT